MFMDEPVGQARRPATPALAVEDVTKRYARRVAIEKLVRTNSALTPVYMAGIGTVYQVSP